MPFNHRTTGNPGASIGVCCSHKTAAVGFNTLCYDAKRRGIKSSARIKLLIIIFLFARITQNPAAKDWSISVAPLFSLCFGSFGEYVYDKDVSGTDIKISELNWDTKPALQYGGRVSISWKNIGLTGFAKGSIPLRSGRMEDSDWDENGIKNIFSVHENALASSYSFGGRIAYTFKPLDFFAICPFVETDYTYISMRARNGYAWDGREAGVAWNNPVARQYKTKGIDYMREEVYTHIGISFNFKINKFLFDFSIALSPYTYVQSLDRHHGRGYYIDIMHGWFASYRFDTEAAYVFNKNISLSLALSWTFTRIIRGATFDSDSLSGPWYKLNDIEGGASRNTAEISIFCTYRFL